MRTASLAISPILLLIFVTTATAQEEAQKADAKLNALYGELIGSLEGERKTSLRDAQRAWITYRDRTCAFEASVKSSEGSGWIHEQTNPALDQRCIQRLTLERAAQLQMYIERPPEKHAVPSLTSTDYLTQCKLGDLQAPFTVQAVGVYEGGLDTDVHLETGHETKVVEVVVNRPSENVVLVLMAYDPVLWKVQHTPDTNIVGVIVGGYHAQAVLGIKRSVPLAITTHSGRKDCGSAFYAYQAGRELLKANNAVKSLTDREIDYLWSNYSGTRVHIGSMPPTTSELVSFDDYKVEDYTQLPRFPSGQKGIERLVELGLLRLATPADLDAWITKASERYKKFNPDLKVGQPIGARGTYVVLDKMTFPTGLYGGHSVAFMIPPGIPLPDGNPGHSAIYFVEDGTCRGAVCQER